MSNKQPTYSTSIDNVEINKLSDFSSTNQYPTFTYSQKKSLEINDISNSDIEIKEDEDFIGEILQNSYKRAFGT